MSAISNYIQLYPTISDYISDYISYIPSLNDHHIPPHIPPYRKRDIPKIHSRARGGLPAARGEQE